MRTSKLRRARKGFIFDEAVGEYVNLKSGEVLSRAEFFDEFFTDLEKEELKVEKLVTPTIEENVNKIIGILDPLKYQLKNGLGHAIEDITPDMIVGETDLVAGAGTDTKIFPAKVPAIEFDPKPNWTNVIEGIEMLLLRLKDGLKNNDPESSQILELGDLMHMVGVGIIPLSNTSRLMRDAKDIRMILEENDLWQSVYNSMQEGMKEFLAEQEKYESEIKMLKNHISSLKGNLAIEVDKRDALVEMFEILILNGNLSVRTEIRGIVKDYITHKAMFTTTKPAVLDNVAKVMKKLDDLIALTKKVQGSKAEGSTCNTTKMGKPVGGNHDD